MSLLKERLRFLLHHHMSTKEGVFRHPWLTLRIIDAQCRVRMKEYDQWTLWRVLDEQQDYLSLGHTMLVPMVHISRGKYYTSLTEFEQQPIYVRRGTSRRDIDLEPVSRSLHNKFVKNY